MIGLHTEGLRCNDGAMLRTLSETIGWQMRIPFRAARSATTVRRTVRALP
jgi:hypothetical protein